MSERDLAEAIHQEIISPESVDAALNLWWDAPAGLTARSVMSAVLARTSAAAIEAMLARRKGPCEERERCAKAIEALATAIRDNGPTTAEGLITGLAGAQVGCLLDAAAALRLAPHDRSGPREEDGYPGSLLPPGWPKGAP